MLDEEEDKEAWADENLDEEIKAFLSIYEKGRETPVDIVSHLEYFYNTLDCSFMTKNPCDFPQNFPCLLYREPASSAESSNNNNSATMQDNTLFEKHRALIFPNSASASNTKSQGSSDISPCGAMLLNVNNQFSLNTIGNSQGSALSCVRTSKKYSWYPNQSIVSPKHSSFFVSSPEPKNVSNNHSRRSSAAVPKNPYTRVSG